MFFVPFCGLKSLRQAEITTLSQSTTIWTETDRRMMARALELSLKGVGQVSPGPLVGCVIVSSAGEVVGEGFLISFRTQ